MLNKIFWFNNSANCNIYNVLSQVVSVEQHTKFFKYIPYFNLHPKKKVYSIDIIPLSYQQENGDAETSVKFQHLSKHFKIQNNFFKKLFPVTLCFNCT